MSSSLLIKTTVFAIASLGFYLVYQQLDENDVAYKALLFIVGGLIIGVSGALVIVPVLGNKVGDFFYSAPEEIKPSPGSAARAKMAQGDYAGAVEEFIELAESDPSDRTPWVEIIRIHREKLESPANAREAARQALSAHEWPEDDEAYFLFRIVEISKDELDDEASAVEALQIIVEKFPETRNSANALHLLREMGQV